MVFQDEEVGKYINQNFISLKINSRAGEGPALREKYKVSASPTVLFFSFDGMEIDRIVGFGGDRDGYLHTIQDYTRGRNTLQDYLTHLKNDPDDIDMIMKVAEKYNDRGDLQTAVAYYKQIPSLDPDDENGYRSEVQFQIAVYELVDHANVLPMNNLLKSSAESENLNRGFNRLLRYYSNQQDTLKVLETYEKAVAKLPDDADMLNGYAWYIFQHKIQSKYAQGIVLARHAVKIAPKADAIWDTLGQLLFADGQVQEAIDAMQKASDLAPDEPSYKENLEKYSKSLL